MGEQRDIGWDWDQLRTVLAVARSGSLSGAARQLGTSHPTVFRRIRTLEQRLGAQLFEKSAAGYIPTILGDTIITAAEKMAFEVESLDVEIGSGKEQARGSIRLTCSDTVYSFVLVPLLAKFRKRFPGVTVEVIVTNEFVNLEYQDIDIAFRSSRRTSQNLYGVKLSDLLLNVHGHRDNPALSESPVRLSDHDWIGFDESMTLTELSSFLREFDLERKVVFRVNSLIGACDAVRQNIGLAMLPTYVGKSVAEIVPIKSADCIVRSELWIVSTRTQQRKPLIRMFFEFIENEMSSISDLMAQ